jgi:alpha-galactosidase
MIFSKDRFFLLNTESSSYAFSVTDEGVVTHLHFGGKINVPGEMEKAAEALQEKVSHGKGTTVEYKPGTNISMDDVLLEVSAPGKGDIRDFFLEIEYEDGTVTSDFLFDSYEILDPHENTCETMPLSYGADDLIKITLKEAVKPVKLELFYSVFEKENVIARRAVLRNEGSEKIKLHRIMSNQVDFYGADYKMITFGGNWVREMEMHETKVSHGLFVNRTLSGVSSNRNNPFVMVGGDDFTEKHGEGYGFNILYSGNHYEALDVSGFYKTRFLQGICPETFEWTIEPGASFETPEAVMTYSDTGYRGVSLNMQHFVKKHIVPGRFRDETRPILLNSWEACYFKINETKLLNLASKAKEAGVELFVMDDGWFKGRNDDHTSLGDWEVDTEKLPNGIKGLSEKIHEMGLKFGIWVEPEMINEDSDLYRAHPEYAMKIEGRDHSLGRNQMILDLTNPEAVDFVIESMSRVFSSGKIEYVKWDMNRFFSDVYSRVLPHERQKETLHRYVINLYRIMKTLTERFPDILFEGCASGGNRFDLGILSYFPQIWGSDDTDAVMRMMIQRGYSYGYPMNTVGSHVSACPNHQTLRNTPLYTRYNIASFGAFGYEMNLGELTGEEFSEVKRQVEAQKKWRDVYFNGDFYVINDNQWMVVSEDKKKAIAVIFNKLVNPNDFFFNLKTEGLADDKIYHMYNEPLKHNIKEFGDLVNMVSPIRVKKDSLIHNVLAKVIKMDGEKEDYVVSGALLNKAGIRLTQAFGGTGYNSETRKFQDFESRIYYIEEVEA